MWRIETIRMALMWGTMLSPLFILFSSVLFPDLHFKLRTLTSCLAAVMVVVPLPFSITYRSGDMDYLLFFSRLTFLRLLSTFVFFFRPWCGLTSCRPDGVVYVATPTALPVPFCDVFISVRFPWSGASVPAHPHRRRHQTRTIAWVQFDSPLSGLRSVEALSSAAYAVLLSIKFRAKRSKQRERRGTIASY